MDFSLTRPAVGERDGLRCQICNRDCQILDLDWIAEQQYLAQCWHRGWDPKTANKIVLVDGKPLPFRLYGELHDLAISFRVAHRIPLDHPCHQIDHIVPIVEGGDFFDLANLRVLCVPCHQLETAKLNRRRSKK